MGRMKDTTIPDFDQNSHYPECPITSFDTVSDGKDCTCQCDLMCPYLNNAAVCVYSDNHTECCAHACRLELVASIREDESGKYAEAIIIAAVEAHREGYNEGYASGVRSHRGGYHEGHHEGYAEGYAHALRDQQ